MTGLLLISVAAAWFFVARFIAKKAVVKMAPGAKRTALMVTIIAVLMALPLIDEIIGGFQFRALCAEGAVLKIDAEKIRGKAVEAKIKPANESMRGTAIPIYHTRVAFFSTATSEVLASYETYVAKGGWFIRALGISETSAPLTIGLPSCSPELGAYKIAEKYQFEISKSTLGGK
jgi:hypothetical protein